VVISILTSKTIVVAYGTSTPFVTKIGYSSLEVEIPIGYWFYTTYLIGDLF
jgi:hypothetical protein